MALVPRHRSIAHVLCGGNGRVGCSSSRQPVSCMLPLGRLGRGARKPLTPGTGGPLLVPRLGHQYVCMPYCHAPALACWCFVLGSVAWIGLSVAVLMKPYTSRGVRWATLYGSVLWFRSELPPRCWAMLNDKHASIYPGGAVYIRLKLIRLFDRSSLRQGHVASVRGMVVHMRWF